MQSYTRTEQWKRCGSGLKKTSTRGVDILKVYVSGRGQGKTSLVINRALQTAIDNPSDTIYMIAPNQKKASMIKKRVGDLYSKPDEIPKNLEFVGADVFFSKGPSRRKSTSFTRFFFDDIDDTLKTMCERIVNGKTVMEFVTATDIEIKGKDKK